MILTRLYACGVRNLAELDLRFPPGLIVLEGANGSGKTAFLESIYLAARGRSFRAREPRDVITAGGARLEAGGTFETATGTLRTGVVRTGSGERTITLEGAGVRKFSPRQLPLLLIGQDDARAARVSAEYRRNVLDSWLFHVEPGFDQVWRSYRHVLRQRNAALRAAALPRVWDEPLAAAGEQLDTYRAKHVELALSAVGAVGAAIGMDLEPAVVYRRGWPRTLTLLDALRDARERDQRVGYTTAGPHRADLELRLQGLRRAEQASAGQYKAALLAIRLAQMASRPALSPLLLLDDLTADLDLRRAQLALAAYQRATRQVFVTTPYFGALAGTCSISALFHVERGELTPREADPRND